MPTSLRIQAIEYPAGAAHADEIIFAKRRVTSPRPSYAHQHGERVRLERKAANRLRQLRHGDGGSLLGTGWRLFFSLMGGLCHADHVTGNCAVFFLWSACAEGGLTLGSLPEWLTFGVTVGALLAAIGAGVAAHRQSRAASSTLELDVMARRQAQARLVYSTQEEPSAKRLPNAYDEEQLNDPKFGWDAEVLGPLQWIQMGGPRFFGRPLTQNVVHASATVHNGSTEMISRVVLYFENDMAAESSDLNALTRSVEVSVARALAPGEKASGTVMIPLGEGVEWPAGHSSADLIKGWVQVIEFRDASGVWWLRREAERIRRVRRHPDELPRQSADPTPLYPDKDLEEFTP